MFLRIVIREITLDKIRDINIITREMKLLEYDLEFNIDALCLLHPDPVFGCLFFEISQNQIRTYVFLLKVTHKPAKKISIIHVFNCG